MENVWKRKKRYRALYSQIGERFHALDSWSMYLITSYEDTEKYIGRKADKNRKIYNGMLKTYYYQFLGPKPPKGNRQERDRMKIEKMIFATGNEGKMREVRMILGDLGAEILSLKEAGIQAEAEENGTTFEENAVIKAKEIMEKTGALVLADDSGLEVDALNGEPGIYSARYMGHETSYHIKNKNSLNGWKERQEKRGVPVSCVR